MTKAHKLYCDNNKQKDLSNYLKIRTKNFKIFIQNTDKIWKKIKTKISKSTKYYQKHFKNLQKSFKAIINLETILFLQKCLRSI